MDAEAAGPSGVCESRPVLRSFEARPYQVQQQSFTAVRPRACLFSRCVLLHDYLFEDVIKTRVSLSLGVSWFFGINPNRGALRERTKLAHWSLSCFESFVVGF
jgi:hypothetical protein